MVVFNNERESERVKTIHLIYVSLLFLFSFAYFSNSNFTSPKKKHKNRLRERVLSREGSLNFSHKEREKRERESTREGTFIEQNRKRGLIEIDTEREKKPFSHPFFFPFRAVCAQF